MKLVLVRHGESAGNVGQAFEGPEPHLTERGRRQAGYAAQRARARSSLRASSSTRKGWLSVARTVLVPTLISKVWRTSVCAAARTGANANSPDSSSSAKTLSPGSISLIGTRPRPAVQTRVSCARH